MKEQRVVIITGMHRSGTSLVANLFQKAGVNIGERLVSASRANPRGFFEDADFCEFHEKLLRERGQTILVSRDFPFEPTPDETRQAHVLIEQRRDHPLWGWKDPRTSLFLEFWHELLPGAYFFLVYRHPLDILLSLLRRKEFYNAGLLEGLESWYAYNLRIERFYERHRQTSLLCHSYSIVDQAAKFDQLFRGKSDLDLQFNASMLDAVYHPEELRRAPLSSEVEAILRSIHPEAVELYEHLDSIADLPSRQDQNPSRHLPALSRLSRFASTLPAPHHAACRRGLLLLLVSFIDPEVIETFFAEHAKDMKELEQGKGWLEEQRGNWQRIAEEREQIIQEQQTWIGELEQGKAWLEEQWQTWQHIAEEREQSIQEQQAWIRQLEEGKVWLEEQWQNWQRIAKEREATTCQQEVTMRQQEAVIRRVHEYLTKYRLKPLIRLLHLDADEG